jgi:hypothetical protein
MREGVSREARRLKIAAQIRSAASLRDLESKRERSRGNALFSQLLSMFFRANRLSLLQGRRALLFSLIFSASR